MLTRQGQTLLTVTVAFLATALPTGSLGLVVLASVPAMLLVLGTTDRAPKKIDLRLEVPEQPPRVRTEFPLRLHYDIRGGRGLVELHQELPVGFDLVKGSNLHVVRKGASRNRGTLEIVVRSRRRGEVEFPPPSWEWVPSTGLQTGRTGNGEEAPELRVQERLQTFKKLPGARGRARTIFPDSDDATIGIQTTEFRDIRKYQHGDPPRTINWKASARAMAASPFATVPLVNEYELEGKKAVWIYLDCGPHMDVGTDKDTAFEAAVQAAGTLASFYVDRGFRLGFTLYNLNEPVMVHPDTGRRQFMRIQEELHRARPSQTSEGLLDAINRSRLFIRRGRTLAIIITRADVANEETLQGLRQLSRLTRYRSNSLLQVLSPDAYAYVPDEDGRIFAARAVADMEAQETLAQIRRAGAELIQWDPARTRLRTLLLQRAVGR